MKRPHNQARIVNMHQMLFEMASGNFTGRIPLSSYDDELETLVVLVNMVAEELKEAAFYKNMVNTREGHGMVAAATFILDGNLKIAEVSAGTLEMLGYLAEEMLGRDIRDFLVLPEQSQTEAERIAVRKRRLSGETFQLQFIRKGNLSLEADCTISRLTGRSMTVLNFIAPFVRSEAASSILAGSGSSIPRRLDTDLIQGVYDYILGHLGEPLPSIKLLARNFGTNDFKLKEGFRFYFHTSIYHFYTEERLKRARLMIEHSSIPLKSIAQQNGFNSYPNFSRTFKKRFGMSPRELPRK